MFTDWSLVNEVWNTGYIAIVRNVLDAFTIGFLLYVVIVAILKVKSRTIYYGVGLFLSWIPLFVAVMIPLLFSIIFFLLYYSLFVFLYFHHFECELNKYESQGILLAKTTYHDLEKQHFNALNSEEKELWLSALYRKNKYTRRIFRIVSTCTCVLSYGIGILLLILQIKITGI